ncbi:MAG TPA: hypothetical protein DIC35_00250 [Candidatus Moranbacteria bacterium]|nr:hypothetical protein [Candidatus Moranbacteria bacterium]
MKWIAISGGWRNNNRQTESDVRREVQEIISRGDGIVSGGALGVDYFATDEALKRDASGKSIRIFLPATLELYAEHYRKRAGEGVITQSQAERLIAQLEKLKAINAESLQENRGNSVIDKTAYWKRIEKIVEAADELVAFHINKSPGTQYTIDQANAKKIPVRIFEYIL